MAKVEFHDFSIQVKGAIEDAAIAFLHEAAGELEAQTIRRTSNERYRGKPAQQLWTHIVDESAKKATVGSPDEASYWEEFGTGEHSLYGNGRKGWWVYVEGNDTPQPNQKYYTQEEAEAVAASMRADGLAAHATNGRKPNRPLHRAFTETKAKIIRRAEQIFKERLK